MGRTLLLTLLGGGVLFFTSCDINMTAIAVPLPTKDVLINLSQSNGTTVGDAKGFEDANPQIALRNPVAVALSRRFNQGSARDEITLPDPEFGDHRVVNYRGKGSPTVRYLTFFNPTSTCYERTGAAVSMPTYPGEFEVSEITNGTTFKTKMIWQADPTGKVTITRRRTGVAYTITASSPIPGVSLTANKSFDPPLEVGERFTHTVAAMDAGSTTQVRFYNQFGGHHDLGGTFEATLNGVAADYPNASVGSYTLSVWETTFGTGTGKVTCLEHPLYLGRRIRFLQRTGTLPVELAVATDYYIVRLDADGKSAYISATPDGSEITFSAASGDFQVAFYPDGRDSTMAGMNLHCLTGANAGEVRAMGDVTPNAAGTVWTVNVTEAFTNAVTQDDTFEILPPDVGGAPVPFDKWAYFLPVCQLNGREQGLPAKSPVTITTGTGTTSFLATDGNYPAIGATAFYNGCPVRFWRKVYSDAAGSASGEVWPTGLTEGVEYFVVNFNSTTGSFQVSATYDGTPISLTGTTAQIHWVTFSETSLHIDNPAPPGFNFNNQRCVPFTYNPYRGATNGLTPDVEQPKVAYHWGWAQRIAERIGRDVYVIDLAVGGSTLSEVVVPPTNANGGIGWFDPASMNHWAPGEAALRARFLRVLDAAELAATREGVQLRIRGVCFPQGESDSVTVDRAERYMGNSLRFKAFVRAELKKRGLWDGEADELPFLHPQIRTSTTGQWPQSATVNKSIIKLANADPFSRTWNTDAYTLFDEVHYAGVSLDTMARSAAANLFDYLDGDDGNVLRICKLAMRMAGESSVFDSVYPPDADSKEAELAAAFYPEAREHMLDRHAWDFAVFTELLEEASANERTHDWRHAYELPLNLRGVIGLGEDEMSAFDMKAVKIKHSIELRSDSTRVLYANQSPDLYIRYKLNKVDPSKFSAAFINACAAYMASMVVRTTMKGEEGIKAGAALEKRAYGMFKDAASVDARHTRDTSQSQQIGWRR